MNVLIRSRGGDFLYDADDLEMMLQDIEQAKVLGAKGVVIGALNADGTINESFIKEAVNDTRYDCNLPLCFRQRL